MVPERFRVGLPNVLQVVWLGCGPITVVTVRVIIRSELRNHRYFGRPFSEFSVFGTLQQVSNPYKLATQLPLSWRLRVGIDSAYFSGTVRDLLIIEPMITYNSGTSTRSPRLLAVQGIPNDGVEDSGNGCYQM